MQLKFSNGLMNPHLIRNNAATCRAFLILLIKIYFTHVKQNRKYAYPKNPTNNVLLTTECRVMLKNETFKVKKSRKLQKNRFNEAMSTHLVQRSHIVHIIFLGSTEFAFQQNHAFELFTKRHVFIPKKNICI